MSAWEIAANAVVTVSIWLTARNHQYTWPTGILGCALFSLVFFRNQLYADTILQVFFIVTSVIGWWQWLHPPSPDLRGQRTISQTKPRDLVWMVVFGIAVAGGYGWVFHHFTNAFMPYVDAAVLVFSVIAQCLQMQRKLETWAFWVLVNTLSVGLYASRGLLLTAFLYAAYWLNAWYGWIRWRREMGDSPAAADGAV